MDFVVEVQTPIRYATTFKKHVGNQRLQDMKSHDHHVMVQQIILVGIQNLLQPRPHKTLIYLGTMFQCIFTKVVNQNEINVLCIFVSKTLCMLEVWFPLAFFDLMTHLAIHLVDKLEICRFVSIRCGYPIKRYLNVLKKYVHNKANPKGYIASEYMYDDALGFCIKCSWIPTNVCGNTRMVQQDENGFWMVNFQCRFPLMVEP